MHLDTNIILAYVAGKLSQSIQDALISEMDMGTLSASVIVAVEALGFSDFAPGEKELIEELLLSVSVLEFTSTIQKLTIAIRQQGVRLKLPDAIIAASALELNQPLMTFDSHFDDVPGLKIIRP